MKVGLIIDVWDPTRGGAERAIARLVAHLLARGDDVHVFAMAFAAGASGVQHRIARPRRLRGPLEVAFARRATEAARRAHCDVTLGIRHLEEVDVYWPHGGLHAATLAAVARAKGGLAGDVARTLRRISLKHRTFLRLEERLLRDGGARAVLCVSPLVRDEIAAAFPEAAPRLEVHPNGVDLATFHPALRDVRREAFLRLHRIDPACSVLVFPGGNWTLKGWDLLWRAMPSVGGPWIVVAAGDGAEFVTSPRELSERVVLLARQDPRDLYAAADLVVQPTFRDPCSLATLEALASGVPVVTTSANGACDAVAASGVGAVVPPGDSAALSAAIRRALAGASSQESRRAARDAVANRPEPAWLDALVASLVRAAARPPTSPAP